MIYLGILIIIVPALIFIMIHFSKNEKPLVRPEYRTEVKKSLHIWQQAAADLDFVFEPQFRFQLDGFEFTLFGYIKHFGGEKGTFLAPIKEPEIDFLVFSSRLESLGFHCLDLSKFDPIVSTDNIKKFLTDLKYYGTESKIPPWYVNKA